MCEDKIKQLCIDKGLPAYECINEIRNDLTKDGFIEKYGEYEPIIPFKVNKNEDYKIIMYNKYPKHKIISSYKPTSHNMKRLDGINKYKMIINHINIEREKTKLEL